MNEETLSQRVDRLTASAKKVVTEEDLDALGWELRQVLERVVEYVNLKEQVMPRLVRRVH
jgi:hypothetical protein